MDGWHRMGLDDDFPIRQVLPVGPARAWFSSWARWAWFFIAKIMYCSKYNTFTSILAFSVAQWRQESVDSVG